MGVVISVCILFTFAGHGAEPFTFALKQNRKMKQYAASVALITRAKYWHAIKLRERNDETAIWWPP